MRKELEIMKYFYVEYVNQRDVTDENWGSFEVIHVKDEPIDDYELLGTVETYEDLLDLFTIMWMSKKPYFDREFIYEMLTEVFENCGMVLPKDYGDIHNAKWWKTRWGKHPIYCRKYKKLCDNWNNEYGSDEYPYSPICSECVKNIKDFIRKLNGHLDWNAVIELNEESEDK